MKNNPYNEVDALHHNMLRDVMAYGVSKGDRTGTGTTSLFGYMQHYDLSGYKLPIISTRKVYNRSWIHETLWFISGSTDVKYLKDHGISIWDSWVDPKTAVYRDLSLKERSGLLSSKGQEAVDAYVDHIEQVRGCFGEMSDLTPEVADQHHQFLDSYDIPRQTLVSGSIGPGAYGAMWRNIEDTRTLNNSFELGPYLDKGFQYIGAWPDGRIVVSRKIDQLQNMIDQLRNNPDSRRIIMHAFDNRMVDFCVLPPCHSWVQCWTRELTIKDRYTLLKAKGIDKIRQSSLSGTFGTDARTKAMDREQHHQWFDEWGIPRRALSLMLVMRSNERH